METQSPASVYLFKSNLKSCQYIFKDGSVAYFTNGIYTTSDDEKAAQLQNEIKKDHPHLSIEVGREKVAADELDPVSVLKKKLKAEILAEMQVKTQNPDRDMGMSTQAATNHATTRTIGDVAAGSASGATGGIAAGSIKVASVTK